VQVRSLPGPPGRTAIGAVPRLENGWVDEALGVRLPLLPFRRGRHGETRDCYSRGAGSIPAAGALTPPWSKCVKTPDSQSGGCGFESRRGCFVWLWGSWPPRRFREPETAGSIPAGQTFVRGGEGAFLASLMSSRRGFESRPRADSRGRSSAAQSARLSGERSSVRVRSSPLRGDRGVAG
jgi:hypothetical protein